MREIKFRGKRLDGKGWAYGYFWKSVTGEGGKQDIIVTDDGNGIDHEVDPATVGQYISKDDIHGAELYEDDIVAYQRECTKQATIVYDEDICAFLFGTDEIGDNIIAIAKHGNVHDNPDLLEKS